jgi:hypothetical protein
MWERLIKSGAGATVAGLLVLVGGCAKSDGYAELGLVEVEGRVTLDGKPLANAKVAFESENKSTSIGTTDSAGHYALMYDSETPGVTPGSKVVRITLADANVEGGGVSEGATAGKETIPAKYNAQSTLKADVSAANRKFDFDLKSTP